MTRLCCVVKVVVFSSTDVYSRCSKRQRETFIQQYFILSVDDDDVKIDIKMTRHYNELLSFMRPPQHSRLIEIRYKHLRWFTPSRPQDRALRTGTRLTVHRLGFYCVISHQPQSVCPVRGLSK